MRYDRASARRRYDDRTSQAIWVFIARSFRCRPEGCIAQPGEGPIRLLDVGSRATRGDAIGEGQSGNGIIADVIDADAVAAILRLRGVGASGTLVEWTHLESVSVATTLQERRRWIERTILQVRDELGLTFHRLLADGRVRIELVEMDEDSGETGAPRRVRPIDPFGFDRWGINGYPRRLSVQLQGGVVIHADLFVLAPGVESGLIGRSRREAQGLYIYRNGRLLQSGGWGGFRSDLPPDLQLARIAIDLAEDALDAFVINPEKRGVILRPEHRAGLSERSPTGDLAGVLGCVP